MSLTEKQKASREKRIGSSDAEVVAGVSERKGVRELFYQFHGELPRYDEHETWEQKRGSLVEGPLAHVIAEMLGIKIRRCPTRVHPKHDFMVANLDFEIVSHPRGPGILEIKTRGGRPFDALPDDLHIQVVHQMAVANRDWAKVAVMFSWGKPVIFDLERDKELEEYLIELEARFMDLVAKGTPPDEAWTPENIGILKKLYPQDSGKVVELPADYADHIHYYLAAKENIDNFDDQKARHEGAIKAFMQDASLATLPGYSISWKQTKPGKTFDADQFKQDHPDLWEYYQKTRPGYRRFQVRPSKELACHETL